MNNCKYFPCFKKNDKSVNSNITDFYIEKIRSQTFGGKRNGIKKSRFGKKSF